MLRLAEHVVLASVALLTIVPARADSSGGTRICEGQYALCSSAKCQAINGDPTHVKCFCEGPLNGLNIGDSSCQARTQQLTSTFSLWDLTATPRKPAKTPVSCTGADANKWAFCLDAPSSADRGGVSCACQLSPASDYTIFAPACPADAAGLHHACAQIWSSASQAELTSGYSQLAPSYGNPPKLAYCPPIGSGNAATKTNNVE